MLASTRRRSRVGRGTPHGAPDGDHANGAVAGHTDRDGIVPRDDVAIGAVSRCRRGPASRLAPGDPGHGREPPAGDAEGRRRDRVAAVRDHEHRSVIRRRLRERERCLPDAPSCWSTRAPAGPAATVPSQTPAANSRTQVRVPEPASGACVRCRRGAGPVHPDGWPGVRPRGRPRSRRPATAVGATSDQAAGRSERQPKDGDGRDRQREVDHPWTVLPAAGDDGDGERR